MNNEHKSPKFLHMMVGLPRSGKSTIALSMGYPVVDTDGIRLALHDTPWNKNTERMVWTMAHYMVQALFNAGHDNVVLDSTNMRDEYRNEWITDKWLLTYHVVPTPPEICKQRAIDTDQEYLLDVIDNLYKTRDPIKNVPHPNINPLIKLYTPYTNHNEFGDVDISDYSFQYTEGTDDDE